MQSCSCGSSSWLCSPVIIRVQEEVAALRAALAGKKVELAAAQVRLLHTVAALNGAAHFCALCIRADRWDR